MADVNGELRAAEWLTRRIKTYRQTYVFIIGEINSDDPQKDPELKEYERRFMSFKQLFDDYTTAEDYTPVTVTIQPGETHQDWSNFWFGHNGIFTNKTAEELVSITFAGEAYGEDANYKWKFRENPEHHINASRFIQMINKTSVDCMLILDCYILTRFSDTWRGYYAMTDIFAMPARMCDERGTVQYEGDMQTSVVRNLQGYANNPTAHRVIGSNEVMESIPELMALDNTIYSKVTRAWSTKPRRKQDPRTEKRIWRFKLYPYVTDSTIQPKFFGFTSSQVHGDCECGVSTTTRSLERTSLTRVWVRTSRTRRRTKVLRSVWTMTTTAMMFYSLLSNGIDLEEVGCEMTTHPYNAIAPLVIVCYHGSAGWNGEEYSLKFASHPKKDFDAYEMIQYFVASGVDVMLLLDCWIPDRFANKWKPSDEESGSNNAEIIARGVPMQCSDGQIVEDDEGDFTLDLANDLTKFMNNINVPKSEGGFKNRKAPLSISTIMKDNKKMCSNPRRISLKRTKAGDELPVARFVMWPADIREHQKAGWFTQQIQGQRVRVKPPPELKGDEAEEEESESDLEDNKGFDEPATTEDTPEKCGDQDSVDRGRVDKLHWANSSCSQPRL